MGILAQLTEATSIAKHAISEASQYGPTTYILIVFLLMVSVERFLNFWFVSKPESIARRENDKSIAESLRIFATNGSAQTLIMQDMVDWQKKVDSGIRELNGRKCISTTSDSPKE